MKIFRENEGGFIDKINFVDENNVFLGYDLTQSCCEYAGWFIKDDLTTEIPDKLEDFQKLADEGEYIFDKGYIKKFDASDSNKLEEGGMVVFKILRDGSYYGSKFLHIFNCHNGYYGHGFKFKIGDEEIETGCL